jgi:hypothetical protein
MRREEQKLARMTSIADDTYHPGCLHNAKKTGHSSREMQNHPLIHN